MSRRISFERKHSGSQLSDAMDGGESRDALDKFIERDRERDLEDHHGAHEDREDEHEDKRGAEPEEQDPHEDGLPRRSSKGNLNEASLAHGLQNLRDKLIRTQKQIDHVLGKDLSWTFNQKAVTQWIQREICLCAAEFLQRANERSSIPRKVDTSSKRGRKDFLMDRITLLGHHFADIVAIHGLSTGEVSAQLDQAVTDLLERLATEFDLGPDNAAIVGRLFGRLLWTRRLRQLLLLGVRNGNMPLVSYLIDSGVPVNSIRGGVTALHVACSYGNLAMAEYLIEEIKLSQESFHVRNQLSGYTPLHDAAAKGHESLVRLIVEQAPDAMEMRTKDLWTPLLLAVANRHTSVANYLIWRGSVLSAQNKWGKSVIDYARSDVQLWDVISMNIPELREYRQRSKKLIMQIVDKYEKALQRMPTGFSEASGF